MDSQACIVIADAKAIAAARASIRDDIDQTSPFAGTKGQEIYVFSVSSTEDRFTIHHYAQALWELCATGVIHGYRIIDRTDFQSDHGASRQRSLYLDTNLVIVVRQRNPGSIGESNGAGGRQSGDEPLG